MSVTNNLVKLVTKGTKLLKEGNLQKAEKYLQSALAHIPANVFHPLHPDIYIGLGNIKIYEGHFQESIKYLQTAQLSAVAQSNFLIQARALCNLAYSISQMGLLDEAIEYYRDSLTIA